MKKQTPDTLDKLVTKIVRKIDSTISNSELCNADFRKIVQKELEEKELYDPSGPSSQVAEFCGQLTSALNLHYVKGFNQDYVVKSGQMLSKSAEKDMQRYVLAKDSIDKYLQDKIGKNSVYQNEFQEMIENELVAQKWVKKSNVAEAARSFAIELSSKYDVIYNDDLLFRGYTQVQMRSAVLRSVQN